MQLLDNVHVRIVIYLTETDLQRCIPVYNMQAITHHVPYSLFHACGRHAHCRCTCTAQLIRLQGKLVTATGISNDIDAAAICILSAAFHDVLHFSMLAETGNFGLVAEHSAAAQLANDILQLLPRPCDMTCRWPKTRSQFEILCCIKFTPQLTFIARSSLVGNNLEMQLSPTNCTYWRPSWAFCMLLMYTLCNHCAKAGEYAGALMHTLLSK